MNIAQFLRLFCQNRKRKSGRKLNIARVRSAIHRCTWRDYSLYKYYGGRGIQVHLQWLFEPQLFLDYLMQLPRSRYSGLFLDRIDNDGHYEPGNLRIATPAESQHNRHRLYVPTPLYELTPELLQCAKRARKGWDRKQRSWPEPLITEPTARRNPYKDLHTAILMLPPVLQSVLKYRFWLDMSAAETALQLMGTKAGVYKAEQQALAKLRHLLS